MIEEAILWAATLHRGQLREGPDPLPYIVHPLEVLTNLRVIGKVIDPELLASAVLHDICEECSATPGQIEARFGQRVVGLVVEVTRREPTESERVGLRKSEVWQLRNEILLAEIAQMSSGAQQIKLADRLSNLQEAMRVRTPKKLARYQAQTQQILQIIPATVNLDLWRELARLLEA